MSKAVLHVEVVVDPHEVSNDGELRVLLQGCGIPVVGAVGFNEIRVERGRVERTTLGDTGVIQYAWTSERGIDFKERMEAQLAQAITRPTPAPEPTKALVPDPEPTKALVPDPEPTKALVPESPDDSGLAGEQQTPEEIDEDIKEANASLEPAGDQTEEGSDADPDEKGPEDA